MSDNSCKCGAPATAARLYPDRTGPPICVSCAAVDRVLIPPQNERSRALPPHLLQSPAALIHPLDTVWEHQAKALELAHQRQNVVIATPTASGKTLVFMLHVIDEMTQDPDAKAVILYPAKALANDQYLRWQTALDAAGFDPRGVQMINGDVPVREREQLLDRASVALMTPDVEAPMGHVVSGRTGYFPE